MPSASRVLWRTVYSIAILPLFLAAIRLAGLFNGKVRESLKGRRGLWRRLDEQLRARDPARPLAWFHVASAGEFLQAMPVMERLMAAGAQCALTVSSISGYRWVQRQRTGLPALVVADYLPVDSRRNMRRMLAMLRPKAVVHVKFDLWPNLIWEARRAGIPQFLVSATLQPLSRRVRWRIARSLYGDLYGAIDAILAVTQDDQRRFLASCPGHPRIRTVGDTRFDSVLDRKRRFIPPALPEGMRTGTVLVVGSSWPPDEEQLFPVLLDALREVAPLRVILAPHEIQDGHLRAIERTFEDVPLMRLSAVNPASTAPLRMVLVDSVGVLAGLYGHGTVAYVGGALTTGVHNVMEPSAWGVPAVFGPVYRNSPEAVALVERGDAFTFGNREELREILLRLVRDPGACRDIGRRAAAFIEQQAGAAQACSELIRERLA